MLAPIQNIIIFPISLISKIFNIAYIKIIFSNPYLNHIYRLFLGYPLSLCFRLYLYCFQFIYYILQKSNYIFIIYIDLCHHFSSIYFLIMFNFFWFFNLPLKIQRIKIIKHEPSFFSFTYFRWIFQWKHNSSYHIGAQYRFLLHRFIFYIPYSGISI